MNKAIQHTWTITRKVWKNVGFPNPAGTRLTGRKSCSVCSSWPRCGALLSTVVTYTSRPPACSSSTVSTRQKGTLSTVSGQGGCAHAARGIFSVIGLATSSYNWSRITETSQLFVTMGPKVGTHSMLHKHPNFHESYSSLPVGRVSWPALERADPSVAWWETWKLSTVDLLFSTS